MKKTPQKHQRLPRFCILLYGIAIACVGLYVLFCISPDFADFFNQYISSAGRWLLAAITAPLPFSLAEFMLLMLPVAFVYALIYAFRYHCDTWKSTLSYVGCIMSLIATIFSIFTLNFAAGYRGHTIDKKLGLEKVPVSAQELYETAEYLRGMVEMTYAEVGYREDGFSQMPYSLDQMREHLDDAYQTFCDTHDFISHSPGVVKPVMLSEGMSHMHITGIYTFFTGEANLNIAFPDYTLAFTAAHEMAHQRGIAREDEANFVAFLVCIGSSDPYLRYSGYLNLYEYVLSALSYASYRDYQISYARLPLAVKGELNAYADFYKKYQHSPISQVSGVVNDTFLQSQGTSGTQSYGMVVDLAVAYVKAQGR